MLAGRAEAAQAGQVSSSAGQSPEADVIERPPCRICGAPAALDMERNGFAIVKCTGCGFRFAVIPANTDLDTLYRDDQFWTGEKDYGYRGGYDETYKLARNLFRERIERIGELQKPARLLEIGCAAGFFLQLARERGWKTVGVEISETMRERTAAMVGCPVYASLDEVAAAGLRFECAVLFEVLEHVTDPVALLHAVGQVMEPGALLAISTPNFEGHGAATGSSASIWFEPPAHISYYGAATLKDCLRRAGFQPFEMERRLNPEMPLPAPIAALLRPLRRGKRLRPRGLIGLLLKRYQMRRAAAEYWLDYLVLYSRKVG